jgi:hypothetical protein
MLPGNETLFADPAWQKQQASELLSSWGFATGKRSFMALVGAPSAFACTSALYCRSCVAHVFVRNGSLPTVTSSALPSRHSTQMLTLCCPRCQNVASRFVQVQA